MRLFVATPLATPLATGTEIDLPPGAARHAQVRRVQPGDTLILFDGRGADWATQVLAVGRSQVRVRIGQPQAAVPELAPEVTLAVGMPANERMDWLVEKATELGVAAVQPLHTERSVLRLNGERAGRKREHWQGVAVAAAEQCGRARVPLLAPVRDLADWLDAVAAPALDAPRLPTAESARFVLSLAPDAAPPSRVASMRAAPNAALTLLSGPEGGLAPAEEAAARAAGFMPLSLGPRVLRAETAPLALLAWLSLAELGRSAGSTPP